MITVQYLIKKSIPKNQNQSEINELHSVLSCNKIRKKPFRRLRSTERGGGVHPAGIHSKNRKTYRSSETLFSNHSVGVAVLKLWWVFVGSSRSVILWCEKNSMFSMERRERKDPRDYFKRNLKVLKLNWKYEYMFYLLKQYF